MGVLVGLGVFTAKPTPAAADEAGMRAVIDSATGQVEIREDGKPVLRYNYRTVPVPKSFFEDIPPTHQATARKYGKPRSNYIHPLYGPSGEELTADWNKDHPHHRGIYWAWPEVQYQGGLGDLHALQKVFARPTGKIELRKGDGFAEIEAENEWRWNDKTPIVREMTTIRAHQVDIHGRFVDLQFEFEALTDGVTLARRGTNAYGGLNMRMATVAGLKLTHHADRPDASPRRAWQSAAGIWTGAHTPASLTILEHAKNPDYPGDYVEYPNLSWYQPTFPRSGTRYPLEQGRPLVLRYRFWIRAGAPPSETELSTQWEAFQARPGGKTTSDSVL